MNETQWAFEYESLNIVDEQKYEDLSLMAKAAKKAAIQLLGLNILPVKDEKTGLLRIREDHEVVPLLAAICREEVAKEIAERFEDLQVQESVQEQLKLEAESGINMTAEAFDEFMSSDIDFVDEPEIKRLAVINSPEYKYINNNIVKNMSGKEKSKFEQIFGFAPDVEPEALRGVIPKSDDPNSIVIESESVSTPNAKRKVEITIEADDG